MAKKDPNSSDLDDALDDLRDARRAAAKGAVFDGPALLVLIAVLAYLHTLGRIFRGCLGP